MAQGVVTVTVNKGVNITVDPDPVDIPKDGTVEWKGTSSQQFNIVLPGGEPSISCALDNGVWVCTSGSFPNTTGKKRRVKYNVTSQGTPALDPEVDIQP